MIIIFCVLWGPFVAFVMKSLIGSDIQDVSLYWQYWILTVIPIIILNILIWIKRRAK